MKRKILAIGLSLTIVFSLTACGGGEEDKKVEKKTEEKVEKLIELTIPAALFDEEGMADINEEMKAEGVEDVKVNDDGSVTYKMNKNTHAKLMTTLKSEVDDTIEDILEDKENYPSFSEIIYNDDLTKFTIKVDASTFSATEEFGALGLYAAGAIYQGMNLVPEDQIDTKVEFVNKDTNEVMQQSSSSEVGQEYQGE